MRRVFVLVMAGLLAPCSTTVRGVELVPFATDGCSFFPDGTAVRPRLWQHCCVAHDEAYYIGGTYAEKAAADEALRDCVTGVCAAAVGDLMLQGVTVGGVPALPTPWRWGFAWPLEARNGYDPISHDARQAALAEIDRFWRQGGRVAGLDERWQELRGILSASPGLQRQLDALAAQLDIVGQRCDVKRRSGLRVTGYRRPLFNEELVYGDGS